MIRDGLFNEPILAVNKENGKAYIHDGNHRIAVFKRFNIEWIPLSIKYNCYIYGKGRDLKFHTVPKVFNVDNWPEIPKPSTLGFERKKLQDN